jgi:hypothetical protein
MKNIAWKYVLVLYLGFGMLLPRLSVAGDTLYTMGMVDKSHPLVSSPNGYYVLTMFSDGTLQILRNDGSLRYRMASGGDFAVMQPDGNFVEYKNPGVALWATGTNNGMRNSLTLYDDGDLAVNTPGPRSAVIWNLGSDPIWGDPTKVGDVAGRDMAYPGLGILGHVGVWDGKEIFQATLPQSGNNAISFIDLFNFKHQRDATGMLGAYWGTASFRIPSGTIYYTGCWDPVCPTYGSVENADARYSIALRVMQIYRIGADYTFGATYKRALSTWGSVPGQRGIYRCDTFVLDAIYQSTFYHYPNTDQQLWVNRWNQLKSAPFSPRTLFNTLKSYQ